MVGGRDLRPHNRFRSGAGEGIRTPDPLITNQMLYQLSYASKNTYPTAGTINEVNTTARYVQAAPINRNAQVNNA